MPAKQHDFTATEIKAGILVLAAFVIIVGFGTFHVKQRQARMTRNICLSILLK